MDVVNLLHKHRLAKNRKDILFLLPKRIAVFSFPLFVTQLRQRTLKVVLLQKIDDAACSKTFHASQHIRRRVWAISQQMQMVRHNHVSENKETGGVSGFVERLAGHDLDCVAFEYRESILRDSSDIEGLGIS